MNGLQQPTNGINSWHAMYSVTDRQKVVQILSSTLKEIQNTNYDAQKAVTMAQEFEKFTFMKSQSRDEYLRLIKQKITQLRGSMRNGNVGINNSNNNIVGGQINNIALQQNGMNTQGMNFMQQAQAQAQAQARQQSIGMQGQLRNNVMTNPAATNQQQHLTGGMLPQQQVPQQGMQNQQKPMQPNPHQIQQISNMIRNAPIPQTLLSKIPNLPPNVNTWTQIFDCFQKKIIPATAMPLVKEIHNTHIQLAIRQHQQQKMNQMQNQRMDQPQNNAQPPPQQANMNNLQAPPMSNSNNNTPVMNNLLNFNMNGMNNMNQQKQQLMQRQMHQQPQQQPLQQLQPQQLQQRQSVSASPQVMNMQVPQSIPQQKPPNFQITQQDLMKYSGDAMILLSKLQANGQIQPNLEQHQKESFIHKYIIHQKTQLWKQQNGQAQVSNNLVGGNNLNMQQGIAQRRLNQPLMQQQIQPPNSAPASTNVAQQQPQQQIPLQNPSIPQGQNMPFDSLPMLNNVGLGSNQPLLKPQAQNNNLSSPLVPQRGTNNIPLNNANRPAQNRANGATPFSLSSILPPLTDELKLKLRQLIEEVSRNNVALKDVTMLLSPQDKTVVRETIMKMSQQYANIDSIISYFFIITRNIEGTKRLIQMKYMTKNIIESLNRGVYLAAPDLLEKLRSQYQKYFDYVKEQFAARRQQQQQSQQTQQSQQPQQQQHTQQPQQQQQQFLNNQTMNPASQMQNQKRMSGSQPMPMGNNTNWQNSPNFNQQQMRNNMNSSPMLMNNSPIMVNSLPAGQMQPQMAKQSVSPRKSSNPNNNSARRKTSTGKSISSAGGIPTPAAITTTPASLTSAIKTPNSMPTPQVTQSQSNNTPMGQSPGHNNRSNSDHTSNAQEIADIFAKGRDDLKLSKRKELSNTDCESFFFSSLANMLDISESSNALSTQNSELVESKATLRSPLSPSVDSREWTCEVSPLAISSSFKQVQSIRDLVSKDIIESCSNLVIDEPVSSQVKRGSEEMNDIDEFFDDKKIKLDESDEKNIFEPVAFDSWKEFIISNMD